MDDKQKDTKEILLMRFLVVVGPRSARDFFSASKNVPVICPPRRVHIVPRSN